MDELDDLFQKNKESFDQISSDKDLWHPIKESLDVSKTNSFDSNKNTWLRIAASILVLVAITSAWVMGMSSSSSFPHISMESPSGQKIVLDPSLNKYTLIQFWASGNVLCDEINCYYYLPAYKKYKDRGFEIYAISLDQNKEQWIKSIEENELPWTHVSDLKGWESPVCVECNISKIPTSFLLDQKGNVILEDVNAEMLDETLGRLLAKK